MDRPFAGAPAASTLLHSGDGGGVCARPAHLLDRLSRLSDWAGVRHDPDGRSHLRRLRMARLAAVGSRLTLAEGGRWMTASPDERSLRSGLRNAKAASVEYL